MHPELIRVGSFSLPTYGLLVAFGFLAALWLLRRRATAFGITPEKAVDTAIWILLAGLIGSKLLLVIVEWPYYVSSWAAASSLLRSAGVFYGGLAGALLVATFLLRRKGIGFWRFVDAAAPAVALGHAIGRLGCFAAGCCWGRAASVPWAVKFTDPAAERNVGVPLNVPLHPTQLYESAGLLALCGLLLLFERRRYDGETFVRYLFGYATLRFAVELFRGDPRGSVLGGALSTSQLIALVGLVAASLIWLRRHRLSSPIAA